MPDEGATVVHDVIRGESTFEHRLMDDLVVARADGTPVYHLAVVVDDHDAGITHVVRGADHFSNTPKQMRILDAMGAEVPAYAHVPLLHGPDGKKLSKRHGAASVQELRDSGYLPEAVRNYLALLGWGFDEETTFHTTEELKERFSLERVSRSPAVFDEQKLRWMNGRYLRELPVEELTRRLETLTGRTGLGEAAAITQDKISTLDEFWALAGFFFDGPVEDPKAREKVLGAPGALEQPGARARRPGGDRGAVDAGVGGGGAARRRGAGGRQAQAGVPAAARGTGGDDRLTGYLRERRAIGARRDAGKGR